MAQEQNSKDWSTSYSQFLARAAAQSSRTLKLYQEALECVAQGKLLPTVFQDHLPVFLQAHAAEYATGLAETGARFLRDLVELGSSLNPQAAEQSPEPPIAAPRFDAANPMHWFEQLSEYAGKVNARAIRAYRNQLDSVAAGEITPSEVQQNTADLLARRAPDYMQQMTRIYFDLLNSFNDLRARHEEAYFRGILEQASVETHATAVLDLSGQLGSTVSANLAITNTTGQRSRIGCEATDIRRSDGVGPAFKPALDIFPEALELGPGDEGTLSVSVKFDPEQFEPGAVYTGALRISGDGDFQAEVELRMISTNL